MEHGSEVTAALTVAIALVAGVLTQAVARHIRLPGIVLLMGAGVLLGPDLLGIVQPDSLHGALTILVGMAVAVILFEGGMSLNLRQLRRQSRPIQLLLTVGALITTGGGALAARFFLGWQWSLAFLFGTLVIVTGPTVIQPLMRRIRVKKNVRTVLEAEGVFIDAIGATVAVVALSLITNPGATAGSPLLLFAEKIGFGLLAGIAGGFLIAYFLKFRHLVPEGMENIFTLSLVLALYQISHTIFPESGIAAVTVAGLVVGNIRTRALSELKEFKEQLTVMLIGMLFVLLAADVRLVEVTGLGWGGMLTVLSLMLVVRPLNVMVATWGSSLSINERRFIAWMAPRGIVAAAVASLFAEELAAAGMSGGLELRALVFLVIAVTVLVHGFSGGFVASLLGVRRSVNSGFVLLGANHLGIALGKALRCTGSEIVFMDANPQNIRRAEEEGFRSIFGNALEERPLQLAELDTRAGCVGITRNEEMNLLFADKAMEEHKVPRAYIEIREDESRVTPEMVHQIGATVLFGGPRDVERWSSRFAHGQAVMEAWIWDPSDAEHPGREEVIEALEHDEADHILPLAVLRGERVAPVDDLWEPRQGDLVFFGVDRETEVAYHHRLASLGWRAGELPSGCSESTPSP